MAFIGWIISLAALLGGLALRQDMPFAHALEISNGLLFGAALAFPPFWAGKPFGISRKPRVMACLAMLFTLPVLLLQP